MSERSAELLLEDMLESCERIPFLPNSEKHPIF